MKKEYEFNWLAWFFAIMATIVLITCIYNYDSANAITFIIIISVIAAFDIAFIRECVLQIIYMVSKRNDK